MHDLINDLIWHDASNGLLQSAIDFAVRENLATQVQVGSGLVKEGIILRQVDGKTVLIDGIGGWQHDLGIESVTAIVVFDLSMRPVDADRLRDSNVAVT